MKEASARRGSASERFSCEFRRWFNHGEIKVIHQATPGPLNAIRRSGVIFLSSSYRRRRKTSEGRNEGGDVFFCMSWGAE